MLILSLFNSANLSFCLVSNTKDDVRDNVYGAKYKKSDESDKKRTTKPYDLCTNITSLTAALC